MSLHPGRSAARPGGRRQAGHGCVAGGRRGCDGTPRLSFHLTDNWRFSRAGYRWREAAAGRSEGATAPLLSDTRLQRRTANVVSGDRQLTVLEGWVQMARGRGRPLRSPTAPLLSDTRLQRNAAIVVSGDRQVPALETTSPGIDDSDAVQTLAVRAAPPQVATKTTAAMTVNTPNPPRESALPNGVLTAPARSSDVPTTPAYGCREHGRSRPTMQPQGRGRAIGGPGHAGSGATPPREPAG